MNRLTLILTAALALCGLYSWHITTSLADTKRELEASNYVNQQMRVKVDQVSELDRKSTEALKNAREENLKLAAAVDAGVKRVFIKATCPATPATPASVANDGVAELSRETRQALFDLRAGIIEQDEKVRALQEYIQNVCLR